MDGRNGSILARFAGELRQLELQFPSFPPWAMKRVFDLLSERLSDDRDFEYAMIDGTIVRVHQQGTGARDPHRQAIGRSRGGLTTKIVALVMRLETWYDLFAAWSKP